MADSTLMVGQQQVVPQQSPAIVQFAAVVPGDQQQTFLGQKFAGQLTFTTDRILDLLIVDEPKTRTIELQSHPTLPSNCSRPPVDLQLPRISAAAMIWAESGYGWARRRSHLELVRGTGGNSDCQTAYRKTVHIYLFRISSNVHRLPMEGLAKVQPQGRNVRISTAELFARCKIPAESNLPLGLGSTICID